MCKVFVLCIEVDDLRRDDGLIAKMRVVFPISLEKSIHLSLIIDWIEILDLRVLVLHLLVFLLTPIIRTSKVVLLQQTAFKTIVLGLLLHRLIYKSMDKT